MKKTTVIVKNKQNLLRLAEIVIFSLNLHINVPLPFLTRLLLLNVRMYKFTNS